MSAITFDTYRVAKTLQTRGFTAEQAEGVIEAMREIDTTQVSTKADLREMELRMTVRLGGMMMALGGVLIAIRFLS